MLPADLAGTWIAHWQIFSEYGDDPAVRSIVVSYSTNILVNVLTALIAFRLLRQLRFSVRESVLGVLALLFCTTHLHYTQNMMENNYIMLLTLTGFSFQYEWLRTGSKRALVDRLRGAGTELADAADDWSRSDSGRDFSFCSCFGLNRCEDATCGSDSSPTAKSPLQCMRSFSLVDRLYQFYRFGSFTNTYVSLFAQEQRLQDPTLPANFPWSTPFYEGFLGCAVQAGEVDLSFRSSAGAGDSAAGGAVEALVAGGPRLWRDLAVAAGRLHQLLCEVHVLGGGFCLG